MNPQSPSFEFIALFNELDKYLEDVINDCDQHMNFAHKLKIISQGAYPMSKLVKQYFYELNYLGELRNHLVHGINLDGKDYITPTEHAIDQMRQLSQTIMSYEYIVVKVQESDLLTDVVSKMVANDQDSVVVYRGEEYICHCDYKLLLQLLSHWQGDVQGVRLSDLGLKHSS